ncbi:MAG: hypothetical protein IJN42_00455, partial [Clostridia bacterium]|nr:hypothetical protein [Clostridia bacterium]
MRQKRMNILGLIYWAVAAVCFIICIWDVVIFGLFAPPVDIQHGIGVAMVCTLSEFALCGLMVLMGLDMRKKFTAKTFKFGLLMVA